MVPYLVSDKIPLAKIGIDTNVNKTLVLTMIPHIKSIFYIFRMVSGKHTTENEKRKLSKEQKSLKKIKKISEDVSLGVHVVVFAIKKLSNPSWRFKIEANINQLQMSGFCALTKVLSVVVAEGGPKQIQKFKRLMMKRINFDDHEAQKVNSRLFLKDGEDKWTADAVLGNCQLIWEGKVQARSFGTFKQEIFQNELLAREVFRKASVEHYWDSSCATALNLSEDF